ncbi:MAG: AMP-binding protein [Desulfobacteraceae bacterium]|nr:AMP-binding protein [Desulfobacteraceae bacterium]
MDYQDCFEHTPVTTDTGFVIIHTAAVAGKPKAALLSHGNIFCANIHFAYLFNLRPQDVHLNILPLFHVAELCLSAASFHAGSLTLNMRNFKASRAVELIEEKKVSVMLEFPPILSYIIDQHEKTGKKYHLFKGRKWYGWPGNNRKISKLARGTFYCTYGSTETSFVATFGAYNDRPGSVGKMIPLPEVRLVDNYDRLVPTSQVGEIVMKGSMSSACLTLSKKRESRASVS